VTTRTLSALVILKREYLELTKDFCAAKLIEYFKKWTNWKLENHRTPWIYQSLKNIYADLMGEHSLHVIRRAIALLESMGILKKQNNPGNGQDKTYQYKLELKVLDNLLEQGKCKSEDPRCKNERSEFNVESHHKINPKNPDPISSDPWSESEEKKPEWDIVELTDLQKTDVESVEPKQGCSQSNLNPGSDNSSAVPPSPIFKIPKPRTIQQLAEKEVWEIAPGMPYPVFLNWRADSKYKPQGGKWELDAHGNAYSEFYNNRNKTTAILFPQFLDYLRSCTENCHQQLSADIKALLPSCFVARPEATEKNVQQLMNNIQQLVTMGVEVALPQGIATASCSQSMSFAQSQETTSISPLKDFPKNSSLSPQVEAVIRYLETGNEPMARAIALRHNIDIQQIISNKNH